jgi:mannose/fructose-specific phosphotransferase system component IIA
MIHLYLCMHTPLLEALCELTEQLTHAPLHATCVGHELDEPERDIYARLYELIQAHPPEEPILVIGDLLGARTGTVALTLPHPHIYFLGGVNLPMTLKLNDALSEVSALPESHGPLERLQRCVDLLKKAGRAGVEDAHAYLRAEGEESMIDASYYEGSVFGMGATTPTTVEDRHEG